MLGFDLASTAEDCQGQVAGGRSRDDLTRGTALNSSDEVEMSCLKVFAERFHGSNDCLTVSGQGSADRMALRRAR